METETWGHFLGCTWTDIHSKRRRQKLYGIRHTSANFFFNFKYPILINTTQSDQQQNLHKILHRNVNTTDKIYTCLKILSQAAALHIWSFQLQLLFWIKTTRSNIWSDSYLHFCTRTAVESADNKKITRGCGRPLKRRSYHNHQYSFTT